MIQVGILAAGDGSRLRAAGPHLPKPLFPVAGVPLIGHILHTLAHLDIEMCFCLINSRSGAVVEYVRQQHARLPVCFIQRDTASSFESFLVLCEHMRPGPFLLTTVDTICAPTFLPQFVAAARRQDGIDMLLSLTTFIDDERPLYVRLNAQQRIVQLGAAACGSGYVTSGFYFCAPGIRAACARLHAARFGALREFLGALLQQGYWLQGHVAPQMIDVDRPQDVVVAERLVQHWRNVHP